MKRLIPILFLTIFVFLSCRGKEEKVQTRSIDDQSLMEINKFLVEKDVELIQSYINRMNWEMTEDSTGFWYYIVEKGNGGKSFNGDIITIDYSESLLDGTLCTTTAGKEPRSFKLGYGEITRGLDEGIAHMQVGDSARFIFPPNMAYGLAGDGSQIPARSVIICHVRLLSKLK